MKKNTKKLLSLALALVMLLGAVPFASAAGATLTAEPGTTVWAGTSVDLLLDGETSNEKWSTNELNKNAIQVKPTATTTYTVEYNVDGESAKKTATITIDVLEKATASSLKLEKTEAYVGEEITLAAIGAGDSSVEFSGSKVTGSKFVADEAGTYEVRLFAENDPSTNDDDVTVTEEIVVKKADYNVTVSDKTISLNQKNAYVNYTAKKGTATAYPTDVVYAITSGGAYVGVNADTGLLTPHAAGTATVKVTANFADGTAYGTATITVTASGVITMEQDGEQYDDENSIDLEFYVNGPGNRDDVEWTFEVSALNVKNSDDKKSPSFVWADTKSTANDRRKYDVDEEGPEIEVELTVKKPGAIAMITASANWTGGKQADAEGVFYLAVAKDETDIIVTLKDDVDEFDWDDEDVFSAVQVGTKKYTTTELKNTSLAELLTLDSGRYIDLDEGRDYKDNKDVGEISASSRVDKYDNKETNTYEMDDLKYLTFEMDDEGVYELEFKQYDTITGYYDEFLVGEGTLQIVVGDAKASSNKKGDINYNVKNKGEVTLDEDDFEEFWDDYCDDEDITGSKAEFGYVMFEDYKDTAITGSLKAEDGDKNMKDTYLFHFDYDDDEDDSSKDFDLNEVVYKASSTKTNYVDEVDFVCYNESGKEICDGTVTFTVGDVDEDEEEEEDKGDMNFTDVKTTDWYYNAVKYVYDNGIMAGTSTTKFSPNTNLTRGMIVTMLYRVENQPSVGTSTNKFTDVKSGDYYFQAVCWAAQNGIVNGVTATSFAPNTNITREQLAAILYRYAGYKGLSTSATRALTTFSDYTSVSDYAETAMKWAVTQSIISGDNTGKLNPKGSATRAEAATMFQRLLAK